MCDFGDNLFGHFGCGFPVRILIGAKGDGNAGDTEYDRLAGGRNGAGVEHADARVGAEVDSADDEVGQVVLVKQAEGQLNAVRRGTAYGDTKELIVFLNGYGFNRVGEGDGVAGRAALGVGGNHMEVAQVADGLVQYRNSASVNAVVV